LPTRRFRLASTYNIAIVTEARKVKPSCTGNSGIPVLPSELEEDVLDDDEETEAELDVVVVEACGTTCTMPIIVG
jgi:hypothetical protein